MQQTINKKFNILQELQQAIKRKAVEKQRSRQHTNKQLLLSIDKRRAESKSIIPPKEKNSDKRPSQSRRTPSKEEHIMKPFLLNNENVGLEPPDKKPISKRLEKLFSLVNYTISSAQKAIKFVNTANFQAEFAVKLFKSDRDSLLLEIQTFMRNQEELARSPTSDGRKQPQTSLTNLENHSLKNENSTLKKQNLIAEAEISKLKEQKTLLAEELRSIKSLLSNEDKRERTRIKDKEKEIDNLLREIHEIDEVKRVDKSREAMLKHNLFLKEKEMEKLKSKMREVYSLEALEKFYEAIEKETKFNMMLFANFENTRKKGELQMILKSLEAERMSLEKKLAVPQSKINNRYTQLRNYIAARVLPLIEGHTGDTAGLSDTEVLELFLRDVCTKQRTRTTGSTGTSAFEKQIAQLKNEKASLTNQVEILKIQGNKDRSEQLKRASKQNELLQANLEEIYDDLNGICQSAGILQGQQNQPDFQHLIQLLREFVGQQRHDHTSSKTSNDPERMIQAVELATEKKLNREQAKQIQDLEQLNQTKAERISELQTDLDKLTRRLQKLENQRQLDRELSQKLKQTEAEVRRANDRVSSLQEDLDLRQKTKLELLEALRDCKKQIQTSESKVQRLAKKEKGLEDTIQQMRKSQDFLKLQMEKLKQQKIASEESLSSEVEALKQALQKSQDQAPKDDDQHPEDLREQISELMERLDQIQEQSEVREAKLQSLSKQKKALEKKLQDQALSMEELLAQASEQNIMEVETYKEEVARLNQSLQRTTILVKQLEEANKTMEQEQVSFLNDIGKLEKSKNQLEEQNRRLHEMVSRLEAQLQEAQSNKEEYTQKLEKELKYVEKQLEEEKRHDVETSNELARLTEQCLKVEQLQKQLDNDRQRFTILNDEVIRLNGVIAELQQTVEKLREENISLANSVRALTQKLCQQEKTQENLQRQLRRLVNQNVLLQQQISHLRCRIEQSGVMRQTSSVQQNQHQLIAMREHIEMLSRELELQRMKEYTVVREQIPPEAQYLEAGMDFNPIDIDSPNIKIAALEQEVDKYKKQLAEVLTQQFSRDIEQINRLQKQHKQQTAQLNKRYSELEVSLSELRSKLVQQQVPTTELEALRTANNDLTKQTNLKEQELQTLTSAISQYTQQIASKEHKVSELSSHLLEVEQELRRTQQELTRAATSRSSVDESSLLLKKYIEEAEKEKAINNMKLTNYTSLVKSILKKIVDIEDIQHQDLDTLLEKGSQKVFEWKKGRNWESSYKAVGTGNQDTQIQPFNMEENVVVAEQRQQSPAKEEIKNGGLPNMADFEDMEQVEMENSIVHEGTTLDAAQTDFEQEATIKGEVPRVQSFITSTVEVQTKPTDHANEHPPTVEALVDQVFEAPIHHIPEQKTHQQSSAQLQIDGVEPIEQQQRLKTESSGGLRDFSQFKENSPSESMVSDQPDKVALIRSSANEEALENLDEFADYKNESMSHSMISDRHVEEEHQQDQILQVDYTADKPVPSGETNAIANEEQFADYEQRSMSASMVSQKNLPLLVNPTNIKTSLEQPEQQVEQTVAPNEANLPDDDGQDNLADEDEFADFKDNSMHASMMSQKNLFLSKPKAEEAAATSPEKNIPLMNEFSDFDEAELAHSRQINQEDLEREKQSPTKPSQPQQQPQHEEGADFNDFGSFHNQSLSKSQLSANLNQFEEFPDDFERALDSSMLSENQFKQVNEGNLHNILDGENIGAFEHDNKDSQFEFEDFIQSSIKPKESD